LPSAIILSPHQHRYMSLLSTVCVHDAPGRWHETIITSSIQAPEGPARMTRRALASHNKTNSQQHSLVCTDSNTAVEIFADRVCTRINHGYVPRRSLALDVSLSGGPFAATALFCNDCCSNSLLHHSAMVSSVTKPVSERSTQISLSARDCGAPGWLA